MVILGLGSNIGNRYQYLREAIEYLSTSPELSIEKMSAVYESQALIPPDHAQQAIDRQNQQHTWNKPFLNCAVRISTQLDPQQLLVITKGIEKAMQREPAARWYPRNIDIDILAWDDRIMDEPHLRIPHPGLEQRPFALWPLHDVAPEWLHPQLKQKASELVKPWGNRFSGQAPLQTRQINTDISVTQLVGIINVTPDSFSDGGLCFTPENALQQAKKLLAEGATVLDLGAESTRPGAVPLEPGEEWMRLQPVLSLIKSECPQAKLSIDTYHPETAEQCLKHGIDYLNDVSGFTNTAMRQLAKDANIPIIFMHSMKVPATKTDLIPENCDPAQFIFDWAQQKIDSFLQDGFNHENCIFDPGIGFGNSPAQAWQLLNHIEKFHQLGVKLYVGHSRKSFLKALPQSNYRDHDFDTAIISAELAKKNIHFLRIHNVAMNKRAIDISYQC